MKVGDVYTLHVGKETSKKILYLLCVWQSNGAWRSIEVTPQNYADLRRHRWWRYLYLAGHYFVRGCRRLYAELTYSQW